MVQFDYVSIPAPVEEYLAGGCRRAAINLWTPGLENEKVQLCGERRNVRIGGVGQTLMVELRVNDRTVDVGFAMQYQLIAIERKPPFRVLRFEQLTCRVVDDALSSTEPIENTH